MSKRLASKLGAYKADMSGHAPGYFRCKEGRLLVGQANGALCADNV